MGIPIAQFLVLVNGWVQIKSQFSDLISDARASKLTSWTEHPQGTLALLLLLDQFPRNIFRGTADAFSSDAMALDIAVTGLAKGQNTDFSAWQQIFCQLPLDRKSVV